MNHKSTVPPPPPPMQPILRPVDTVLNFGIRNMFTILGLLLFTQAEHGYIWYRYQFYLCHTKRKKYLWFRFLTDPIFFCQLYYFFKAIDRATLFSPGGCGLLPKWHLLSKNIYFRPTDPNFFVI